jgi:Fe-S-cluster-containing dehydrogenase component
MKKWIFIIDIEKCIDCNNCFLSCKDEHVDNDWPPYSARQPRHGHRWMNIMRKERGTYPHTDVAYRPTTCMHCDDAPCINKSQRDAIYKRPDGIVLIDPQKSKGHKEILGTCPYGAIWWNDELDLPQKCTLCAHLLDEGAREPRCVQACPTGALRFLKCSDKETEVIIRSENLEVLNPEYGTYPRVYYRALYKYDKSFIAGSITVMENGRVDCAEGAEVILNKNNQQIEKMLSDCFGDFKFDKLQNGTYNIKIFYKDYPVNVIDVEMKTSTSLPDIMMSH